MTERKGFPLRVPEALLDELRAWAADEMRSVNAQIEYLLREALKRRRREPPPSGPEPGPEPES